MCLHSVFPRLSLRNLELWEYYRKTVSAFTISIEKAGWLLNAFALIVAVFGSFVLMVRSSFKRKSLLVSSLLIFGVANILSACIGNFYGLLVIRMIPAFFHLVYCFISYRKKSDTF